MLPGLVGLVASEVGKMEQFAAANPLTHPGDPEQIDAVLGIALDHPEWGHAQIIDLYERKRGRRPKVNVPGLLRRNFLAKADGREDCLREIERQNTCLQALLCDPDGRSAQLSYRSLQAWLSDHSRANAPVVARGLLRELGRELGRDAHDHHAQELARRLSALLQCILLLQSLKLLRNIVASVAEARGFRERRSLTERVEDLISSVDDAVIPQSAAEEADQEAVEAENTDLKAALFGLRQELTDLRQRIEEMKEAAQTDALVYLLAEMNSAMHGYLLDNIVHSNRLVTRLLAEGWTPEVPEIEGVLYSLKMLVDYLQRLGIHTMRELGDHEKIRMEDLTQFTYVGSEFRSTKEVKCVQFRTPGWMYRDRVISRPQAIEVKPQASVKEKGGLHAG